MSVRLALLLGAALCLHVFCSISGTKSLKVKRGKEYKYQRISEDIFDITQRTNELAFRLYSSFTSQIPGSNIIFSPISIAIALGFLAMGAEDLTKAEILETLQFNLAETPESDIHQDFQRLIHVLKNSRMPLKVNITTAVFLDENLEIKKKFLLGAWALYTAEAISTDFSDLLSAKKLINDYVEQTTHGKILDIVHDLDELTKIVLVNSIFFKGKWEMPFNSENTYMSDFYMTLRRKVTIPMMRSEYLQVPYFRDRMLRTTVVQLPYLNNSASILFILPNLGQMSMLESSLKPNKFYYWREALKMRKISLFLPKFSIFWDYDLDQILPNMGIVKVFSQDSDLSGITTAGRNLSLSRMVHKTVLEVTEEGTEPETTTGMYVIPFSVKPKAVRFNRPFLVAVISEDTQGILFLGKVVNPRHS